MSFEVSSRPNGWFVTHGPLEFGPYESQTQAMSWAVSLTRQSAWLTLSPDGGDRRDAPAGPAATS